MKNTSVGIRGIAKGLESTSIESRGSLPAKNQLISPLYSLLLLCLPYSLTVCTAPRVAGRRCTITNSSTSNSNRMYVNTAADSQTYIPCTWCTRIYSSTRYRISILVHRTLLPVLVHVPGTWYTRTIPTATANIRTTVVIGDIEARP